MPTISRKTVLSGLFTAATLALLAMTWATPARADKKKDAPAAKPPDTVKFDTSALVWPQPPAIGRLRYLDYFSAEKKAAGEREIGNQEEFLDGSHGRGRPQ
jgi:hypothetical protein